MHVVAHHLQKEALKREQPARDLFGRSAYNRYYYATFLCVRDALSKLDTKWAKIPHATYPDLLAVSIRKEIGKRRARAQKLGDKSTVSICTEAIHAAHELAKVMKTGLAIRVIADYRPEIEIEFVAGERFKLNSVDITEAHQWPNKARSWSETISTAWKQTGA